MIAIYVKDGKRNAEKVDFIALMLNKDKSGETRNHNRLARGWVGLARSGFVWGRVKLGEPYQITKGSPEYKNTFIANTEYDIQDGGTKWYYPVLDTEDYRNDPKPIIQNGNYAIY